MASGDRLDPVRLWKRYQTYLCCVPELNFMLDISRMDFDEGFLESMASRMEEALDAMEALEGGAIANPDENRMVGHYWLRDPERAPNEEIASQIRSSVKEIKLFAQRIHSGEIRSERGKEFQNILVVGIGGSALGPQLVADALGNSTDPMHVYFCDNTDPDGIERTLGRIGASLAETLTLVISKSGGTKETRNAALEVAAAFSRGGLAFPKAAVAITGVGSALDRKATEEAWIAKFPMWDWIGGRTSELSAVGLLPAALQGIDIEAMLAGAGAMDEATRSRDTGANPAALLALMWHHAGAGRGLKDMVILPYKDRLLLFSKYLQQLVMESLGKERDRAGAVVNQGIAVYGNKGSTDQHAYVQQLREGVNNFFVTFIEVLRDRDGESIDVDPGVSSGDYLSGFLQGTRRALYENGRESMTLTIDEVSPRSLGALIALFERAVGFYASLINVNAYHQPGVEAGKKAAEAVIELQRKVAAALKESGDKGQTAVEIAGSIGEANAIETVFKILEHLAANPCSNCVKSSEINVFQVQYSFRS